MEKNALVLSGGGSRGGYEIGVWQALREVGVELHMVTGTSVGALNGAMVAQDDFDAAIALWKELETHMLFDVDTDKKEPPQFDLETIGMTSAEVLAYAKEIITKGGATTSGLNELIKKYIEEDRVRNSPVQLGIVTVEFPSMEPHYLFAPDIPRGKLHDYLLASAACFPAVQAKEIDGMRFIDGGYVDAMPVDLAIKNGAENIIAVDLDAAGFVRKDTIALAKEIADHMVLIKSHWDLGNFLIFDKLNTKRIIRLGYLDTMKAFGAFDGKKYTFIKGTLKETALDGAEAAAAIFKLDPTKIYRKDLFQKHLTDQIKKAPSPELSGIHSLKSLRRKLKADTLVLYIIDRIKKRGSKSNFSKPAASKLLKDEVLAANYIMQNNLLP